MRSFGKLLNFFGAIEEGRWGGELIFQEIMAANYFPLRHTCHVLSCTSDRIFNILGRMIKLTEAFNYYL